MARDLLWQRWDEVDRLLNEALDLPSRERKLFVERAAGSDVPFRDLLLELVERLETDDGHVTAPSEKLVAAAFDESVRDAAPGLPPGTTIGRYVIVARRARGGMATVYEAKRSDGVYRQRVALKVLRRGLDTDDLIARFLNERQILSSLSHPNIARLLDGGSTPDGRPYLVMDLVDGRSITEHADAERLEISARLSLFLNVADAVHAAHRQLVVHRDIKPSNVLVDREGQVKLLDFGIAKLLEPGADHTVVGVRVLTPDYASPEQVRGDAITTATDVYQLGLLLRELLTGVRPRRDESPVRPSRLATREPRGASSAKARADARATTPARLARQLSGDLDLIVGKALRPEPEERYASADELTADVRRHLRGLPILAHEESSVYRARKFVARNTAAVAGAAAAVLLLLGYAITLTVQGRRIASERDRAEMEALKAGQVTEFLVDLFRAADPNRSGGEEVTARALLEEGARQLNEGGVQDPGVRVAMLTAMGRSYHALGIYDRAASHFERAIQAHRDAGLPEDEALVNAINALANAVALTDRTRALALYDEALRVAERTLGPNHTMVGRVLTGYAAKLSLEDGGGPRAQDMLERAVRLLRNAPGDVREDLANALFVSAYGKPSEIGIPRMREALELRRAFYPERHSIIAASLSDLGLAMEAVDPIAADTLMAKALDILVSIHGERHATLLAIMNNLAALRRDRGAYAEAEPLFRRALDLRREHYPEQVGQQAFPLYGLGIVLVETGRAAEGEARLREAVAILEQESPGSPVTPLARASVGHALARQERFADAERVLVPATEEVLNGSLGKREKVRALGWVVALYDAWDRRDEAAAYRRQLNDLLAEA